MNHTHKLLAVTILSLSFALAGCTHYIPLTKATPVPVLPTRPADKGVVRLVSITDARPYNSDSSRVPEFVLHQGGHTWIMAYPVSAEIIFTGLLKEGFARRGYTLQSGESLAAQPTATVQILSYRGYNVPAAWSWAIMGEAGCNISLTKNDQKANISVYGYGKNVCQNIVRDGQINIHKAMENAYEEFLAKLDVELEKAGF